MMKITFDFDKLEWLDDISAYNYNYYKLPYSINGNNILYEVAIDDSYEVEYYFGIIENDSFVANMGFYGSIDGSVNLLGIEIEIY